MSLLLKETPLSVPALEASGWNQAGVREGGSARLPMAPTAHCAGAHILRPASLILQGRLLAGAERAPATFPCLLLVLFVHSPYWRALETLRAPAPR